MTSQFIFVFITTLAGYMAIKRAKGIRNMVLSGKHPLPKDQKSKRWQNMLRVALGQSKMTVRPVAGFFHILIYAGFVLINLEVLEILLDGIFNTHRIFMPFLGSFYGVMIGFFEILGVFVILACLVFLYRRNIQKIDRFKSPELTKFPLFDANVILIIEIILMGALLKMNAADNLLQSKFNMPISQFLAPFFSQFDIHTQNVFVKAFWWFHWVGILVFINYIPYSKHLHIFLAFPNTYFADLKPKGQFNNMESVTTEVKLMLDPNATPPENYEPPVGFGAKDVEDLSQKNLLNAFSCTECGRCTSVCPANLTGKLLSPRKVMMDVRDRVEEKHNAGYVSENDTKNLHNSITAEELWACTSCNACVEACPIDINPLDIIIQMRQYLVMEQSQAPSELNNMFNNLENNGAPWQFSPSDRANWSQ